MSETLVIRLIRSTDPSKDDKIVFRRRHPTHLGFLMRYTDGLVPNKVWVQEKSFTEVMTYLDRTFLYLKYDNDPYMSIQIEIPSHPVILIKMCDFLDDLRTSTLQTMYDYLNKPPGFYYV
jgi:hypothetical protein